MKKLLAVSALAALVLWGPLHAQSFRTHVGGDEVAKRTTTVVQKEEWSNSLDELMAKAKAEKKLVFWLQLVGNLDSGL